jgi:2-polyprenyl-3-methyl-5-hydroxy-6-metoxy-1,4-benzoquinol methylase
VDEKHQMEPCGLALSDYLAGDRSALVSWRQDNGREGTLPAAHFFRSPAEFSPIERLALAECVGPVLDVGAGAGLHALALQDRGVAVTALDISAHAVDVMRRRGVREARCGSVFDFTGGPFATILMLWHGLGVTGDLPGLDRFLRHARTLLSPGGMILADSLDVRRTPDEQYRTGASRGRYRGEIRMRFQYRGTVGPFFHVLHVDPETLAARAERSGWRCEVLLAEPDGDYLACLRRVGDPRA